jgi:hypothetical protein
MKQYRITYDAINNPNDRTLIDLIGLGTKTIDIEFDKNLSLNEYIENNKHLMNFKSIEEISYIEPVDIFDVNNPINKSQHCDYVSEMQYNICKELILTELIELHNGNIFGFIKNTPVIGLFMIRRSSQIRRKKLMENDNLLLY